MMEATKVVIQKLKEQYEEKIPISSLDVSRTPERPVNYTAKFSKKLLDASIEASGNIGEDNISAMAWMTTLATKTVPEKLLILDKDDEETADKIATLMYKFRGEFIDEEPFVIVSHNEIKKMLEYWRELSDTEVNIDELSRNVYSKLLENGYAIYYKDRLVIPADEETAEKIRKSKKRSKKIGIDLEKARLEVFQAIQEIKNGNKGEQKD